MKTKKLSKEFYFVFIFLAVVTLLFGWFIFPKNNYEQFIGTGSSMEPTLFDGDNLSVDSEITPEILDIVVFTCQKCNDIDSGEILTKRVYEINDKGCFWLLGDNANVSVDSRQFGWVCDQKQIELHGVVVGINQN